jgi:sn-glycerol 3-phosphate transport system ATP-binding protein
MRHEIRRLHQQVHTTSLYVTHDQTEAMTMADRILVLNQGIVEQIGTPHELYQKPDTLFVAGFTGYYPLNILVGVVDKPNGCIQTRLGVSFCFPELVAALEDGVKLALAIRAEHVELCSETNPERIAIDVEFVDDMGADKLIRAKCIKNGALMNLRISAEKPLASGPLYVVLPKMKLHVFHPETGRRIGG